MLSSRCGKSVVLVNTQWYSYLSRTSQPSSTSEGGAHEAPLLAEELLLIGGLWVRVATVNHLWAEEWPRTAAYAGCTNWLTRLTVWWKGGVWIGRDRRSGKRELDIVDMIKGCCCLSSKPTNVWVGRSILFIYSAIYFVFCTELLIKTIGWNRNGNQKLMEI